MSLWQRLTSWLRGSSPQPAAPVDPTAALGAQMLALESAIREAEGAAALLRNDYAVAKDGFDRVRAELAQVQQRIQGRSVQIKTLLLKRGEHDLEAQRLLQENTADEGLRATLQSDSLPAAQAALNETTARLNEVESTLQKAKAEHQRQARLLQELRLEERAGAQLATLESLTEQGEETRLALEAQRQAQAGVNIDGQMEALRQSAAQHEAQEAVAKLKSQIRRPHEEGGRSQ